MRRIIRTGGWLGVLVAAAGWAIAARAGDWPQILGPHRNGQASQEPALEGFAPGGPRTVWSHDLGAGYAGPAVVGERVFVFHRVADQERLEALDVATGKPLWHADFPASYRGGIDPDTGPRCVPLVHATRVYVFGAAGDLHCVNVADGTKQWTRETYTEFAGSEGYFGAGSTPIVAADRLLVNVGGRKAGLVAFNVADGSVLWQATDEGASYSSPTFTMNGGQPCVIFVTRLNAVGVDPATGTVRFRFPFGRTGPTVNAATPLVFDGFLFVSANYGVGAQLARLHSGGVEKVWANDQTMSSQYATCVYHQDFLYGLHGREDLGTVELRCFEARTGRVRWQVPDFGAGHLILVGDKLLILKTDGTLTLALATPAGFRPLATAAVSTRVTRALPALSNGKFFFRDNDRAAQTGRLHCLELSPR